MQNAYGEPPKFTGILMMTNSTNHFLSYPLKRYSANDILSPGKAVFVRSQLVWFLSLQESVPPVSPRSCYVAVCFLASQPLKMLALAHSNETGGKTC